ncbi:hypothetical protein [Jannaschia aquimarina]|uniref:Uncharacterized protein n=1 Tax=Jannaschia aquimarina TaxID=935700 RepID=A0A0D1ENQ8_9RHOB|nr:hypothetical protein [Jannaschia aquimarina]KIT17285.1 hypothetical protein jaqu_10160 [Jannaschia aquimarina]SNT19661.1 hypothetical protein SAMN05421775_107142 [Jannaschia aquimarina]
MARTGWITRASVTVAFSMALTPAVFALGPKVERAFFPVVEGAELLAPERLGPDYRFRLRFRKLRQCEFLGLSWFDGERRLTLEPERVDRSLPDGRTLPTGDRQVGPFRVRERDGLTGTRAFTLHRCHPLWVTITDFWRG